MAIGHFYHEGPNGRRRGVIRDVPPEETPVPAIATRLRRESADLFEKSEQPEPQPEALPDVGLPTIIEVPQWLARLEPQLAALDWHAKRCTQNGVRNRFVDSDVRHAKRCQEPFC